MDQRLNGESNHNVVTPGLLEQILLGAVRLASLPLLLLAIALMSLIYGVAFLARCVGMIGLVGHRRRSCSIRSLGHPASPQDA